MFLFFAYEIFQLRFKIKTLVYSNVEMATRPVGVSAIPITLSDRLLFRFIVGFKPNLVSLGTQRIATSRNGRVKLRIFLDFLKIHQINW